jgi:hypothetical protein
MPLPEDESRVWANCSAKVHATNINDHWSVSLNITETAARTHA